MSLELHKHHMKLIYDDTELNALKADRRLVWIWSKDIKTLYNSDTKKLSVDFYLPKGVLCYYIFGGNWEVFFEGK